MKAYAVLRFGLSLAAILAPYALFLYALASVTLFALHAAAAKHDVVHQQLPDSFLIVPLPEAGVAEESDDLETGPDEGTPDRR